MSAAAVIAIRRRRIVERFRQAAATDASHAVTLESLEVRPSWIFDQMVRNGIFTAVGGDHYFMNEQAATEFLRQKCRMRDRNRSDNAVCVSAALPLWLGQVLKLVPWHRRGNQAIALKMNSVFSIVAQPWSIKRYSSGGSLEGDACT